jgi:hypothetical protein
VLETLLTLVAADQSPGIRQRVEVPNMIRPPVPAANDTDVEHGEFSLSRRVKVQGARHKVER